MRFDHLALHAFVKQALECLRVPSGDADTAADALISADLMGIDSHGIAHLPWHPGYVRGLQRGWVKPDAKPYLVTDSASLAVLDGDGGMGVIVADRAQQIAISKAASTGIGIVAVRNSRHVGAASVWTLKAAAAGMIGIVCSNGGPIVVPAQGRERLLGTNPLSIAAPAQPHPFLLDYASSVVAAGKLEIAQREERPIPEGWALDADGNPSTDPAVLRHGGALLPLGSDAEHSWHKGYALGAAIEILAGMLSGGGTSPGIASDSLPMCHFHLALRIDAMRPLQDFVADVTAFGQRLRSSDAIDPNSPVLVPGDPEFAARAERLAHGIPLHKKVITQLVRLAEEVGVPQPEPLAPAGA
jgi:LDH2 family malate/lactate/ureidoglycolate dehydrogenase